jgi:hypothetical protein
LFECHYNSVLCNCGSVGAETTGVFLCIIEWPISSRALCLARFEKRTSRQLKIFEISGWSFDLEIYYLYFSNIFFSRRGMVHMHHHTHHHIPTDRNNVIAMITESNLMCGESHDKNEGKLQETAVDRYVRGYRRSFNLLKT